MESSRLILENDEVTMRGQGETQGEVEEEDLFY